MYSRLLYAVNLYWIILSYEQENLHQLVHVWPKWLERGFSTTRRGNTCNIYSRRWRNWKTGLRPDKVNQTKIDCCSFRRRSNFCVNSVASLRGRDPNPKWKLSAPKSSDSSRILVRPWKHPTGRLLIDSNCTRRSRFYCSRWGKPFAMWHSSRVNFDRSLPVHWACRAVPVLDPFLRLQEVTHPLR